MLIELSDILSVKDKELDVQADIEMERFTSKMGDYAIADRSPLNIHLKNMGKKKFSMKFLIDLSLIIPCDRCLTDVKYDMNIEVHKEIDMNESDTDGVDIEDEYFYISDHKLDIEAFVYNEILINLPMKVLCSENCKGICNRCGANLNSQTCDCDTTELDPRMSKIRDIFNNFKEV
ncbi:MAG: DUF177 domain-containing protein [Lachnospiraceae bacterium]|nr:DUF177 domain-containing protein [Lachnospiraceae bacterium]